VSPTPSAWRGALHVPGGTVGWAFSTAADGDLGAEVDDALRHQRQQAIVAKRWVMAHQVHGADVVDLTGGASLPAIAQPGAIADVEADAIVTDGPDLAVAVRIGDCAPLLLVGAGPVVAAVHAGWRGLVAGVVETAVATLGVPVEHALLGPCIGACCYAFAEADLAPVADHFGQVVRATTTEGAPALDVPAAVDAALMRAGAPRAERIGGCTGCGSPEMFSHRVRHQTGRQAGVVWIEATA
jgi:polyphenol oxidase